MCYLMLCIEPWNSHAWKLIADKEWTHNSSWNIPFVKIFIVISTFESVLSLSHKFTFPSNMLFTNCLDLEFSLLLLLFLVELLFLFLSFVIVYIYCFPWSSFLYSSSTFPILISAARTLAILFLFHKPFFLLLHGSLAILMLPCERWPKKFTGILCTVQPCSCHTHWSHFPEGRVAKTHLCLHLASNWIAS